MDTTETIIIPLLYIQMVAAGGLRESVKNGSEQANNNTF